MTAKKNGITQETVAKNLRSYRAWRGLSQEGLGNAADVDRTYVGRIEQQTVNASIGKLESLSNALNIDPVLLYLPSDKLPICSDDGEVSDCEYAVIEWASEDSAKVKFLPELRKETFEKILQDIVEAGIEDDEIAEQFAAKYAELCERRKAKALQDPGQEQ